jgi:hypothetical protein
LRDVVRQTDAHQNVGRAKERCVLCQASANQNVGARRCGTRLLRSPKFVLLVKPNCDVQWFVIEVCNNEKMPRALLDHWFSGSEGDVVSYCCEVALLKEAVRERRLSEPGGNLVDALA